MNDDVHVHNKRTVISVKDNKDEQVTVKVKPRFYLHNFTIVDELILLVSEQNLDNKSIASVLTTMFNNTFKESIKLDLL